MVKNEEKLREELRVRTLYRLKETIESLVFQLNTLHPDFLEADDALKELLEWKPEQFGLPNFFKKSGYYSKGDEDAPFFSEAFLYNLLGKEDARTLLHLLKEALGLRKVNV